MYPGRKIKKRGKFKAPEPCLRPPCGHVNHPVAGADPGTSYLDVIPEARALYKSKRKSQDNLELSDGMDWKRYRERQQVSMPGSMRPKYYVGSSSESASDGSEEDDEEEEEGPTFTLPLGKTSRKRRRIPNFREVTNQIDDIMKDFRLTDETYEDIMKILDIEMAKGLRAQTNCHSTVRMFPTYVRSVPDGTETGQFLALDLGGTNFRVLLVTLNGKEPPSVVSKLFLIPNRIMLGHGKWLFEHIANCIYEFLEQENLLGRTFPLGFTFSFPCRQMGLASAQLVRWTKGFRCEDVEGYDVVKLLHEAIETKGNMSIEIIAIINDPVGALMFGAHQDKNCHIGLILGTGTNCCYMEDLKNVELWDGDNDDPRQVIVNTEWGAFGDNGVLDFVRNPFDRELDRKSLNPGHQLFEKMISGMYMGEIVRLVLIQLTAEGLLFGGEGSEELLTRNNFLTKYISEIEGDKPDGNFSNTRLVLQELDIPHFTIDDCRHVQHVCWQVSQRAAYLAATAVAAVVNRLNRDTVTVCVDGSLYRFHPHFHDLMNKKIAQLIKPHHKFQLTQSHDGSGKGAALVAAVALRMRGENESKIRADSSNNNNNSTKTVSSSSSSTSSTLRKENQNEMNKIHFLGQRIEEEMV